MVLSATGLLARFPAQSDDPERSRDDSPAATDRAAHDIVASAVSATARGTIGAVTSAGRMIRLSVLEIPSLPPSDVAPSLAGGHPVTEFVTALTPGEKVLALVNLHGRGCGRCTGHRVSGIVKRVLPEYPANRDEFELITLKDDDQVVGAAQLSGDDAELVFITTDAQLLRFPAAAVRPQGRPAGGMAGIRLDAGASVVWFGALGPSAACWDRRRPTRPSWSPSPAGLARCRAPAARRQGHPVRRVPGQGPRDRRRPLPALPQGRGRPDPGLDRPGPRARRHRFWCSCGPGQPSAAATAQASP